MKEASRGALIGILLILIVGVYVKTLRNPTFFDDHGIEYKTSHAISSGSRQLDQWLFAETFRYTQDISAHRAVNIGLHLVAVVLIYLIISQIFQNRLVAYLSAAWFGFNPAAIYTVVYLMERTILLAAVFDLAEILFAYQAVIARRVRDTVVFFGLALLCYLGAVASKEHAYPLIVVFPLMVLARRPARLKAICYGAVSIGLVVFFLVKGWQANSHFAHEGGYYEAIVKEMCGIKDHLWSRSISTQAYLFFKYIWAWVNPLTFRAIEMREPFAASLLSTPQVYGLMGYGLWLIVGLVLLIERQIAGFAMCLLWCLYLVEIQTVRLGEMFVLYRSYLYAISYVLIFASVLNALKLDRKALMCGGGCLMLFLGIVTFKDLDQFRTPVDLWQRAAQGISESSPHYCQSARIYNNFGAELLKAKRPTEAIPYLEKAANISGDSYGPPIMNLGSAYIQLGDKDKALECYGKAAQSNEVEISKTAKKMLALEWK